MQILRPYSIAGRQHASSIFHQDKITNRFFQPSPAFQISGAVGRNMSLCPITELKSTATIPDLFVSFLAQKPVPNPNYAKVKGLLEASMREYVSGSTGKYYFLSIYILLCKRLSLLIPVYIASMGIETGSTQNGCKQTSPISQLCSPQRQLRLNIELFVIIFIGYVDNRVGIFVLLFSLFSHCRL